MFGDGNQTKSVAIAPEHPLASQADEQASDLVSYERRKFQEQRKCEPAFGSLKLGSESIKKN